MKNSPAWRVSVRNAMVATALADAARAGMGLAVGRVAPAVGRAVVLAVVTVARGLAARVLDAAVTVAIAAAVAIGAAVLVRTLNAGKCPRRLPCRP